MKREKIVAAAMLLLEVVAVLGFVGIIGWMTVRYIQVGEQQTQYQQQNEEDMEKDPTRSVENTECQTESGNSGVSGAETLMIQVRIMDDNFSSAYHNMVTITSAEGFSVAKTEADEMGATDNIEEEEIPVKCENYAPDTTYSVNAEELNPGERINIWTESDTGLCVSSLHRAEGTPVYEGILSLYGTEYGILLINRLPLERYLTYVVSSEMPSYYPLEAQKAQAVCARTYAWNCMKNADSDALFDLDDSVNYQVYNNYSATEYSETAVAETIGEILPMDEVLYYSTSCMTEKRTDLAEDEAFRRYLEEEPAEDAEYGSPWVRWETTLTVESILKYLNQTQNTYLKTIESIRIRERREDGQVQKLEIQGDGQSVIVEGEYQIRAVLSTADTSVVLRDGTEVDGMKLLPSAYFVFGEYTDTVVLRGGGYGHGIGMSQYGAAAMAEEGLDYSDILRYYYENSDVIRLE